MPDQDRIDYEDVSNIQNLEARVEQLENRINSESSSGSSKTKVALGLLTVTGLVGVSFLLWKQREQELRSLVKHAYTKAKTLKQK